MQCQKWLFAPKRGWKKTCVKPGQPVFGDRLDSNGFQIEVEHPASGCVAMFDDAWSDFRNWEAKNRAKEMKRPLKPAWFRQYVEIKEAGVYELNACMARDVWMAIPNEEGYARQRGGIHVSLNQWHTSSKVTTHLALPWKKAMFGPNADQLLEGAVDFDVIVQAGEQYNGEIPPPDGTVVGYVDTQEASVSGGGIYYGERALAATGYYIDSYDGHAGLRDPYSLANQELGIPYPDSPPTQARWTCHTLATSLAPGFYFIHAEIFPNSYGGPTDYQSFGAIRNIELKMVAPEG